MIALHGDVLRLLDALGGALDDERVVSARSLFGEVSEQRLDPKGAGLRKEWLTLDYRGGGATFSFGDGELCKIVVRTAAESGWAAYSAPTPLIDGVDASSTRETLRGLLGEPKKTRPDTDLWQVGRRFLHARYTASGTVGRISAMLRQNGQ